MSERNVKLFYNEMCTNKKLQNEIKDVIGGTLSEKSKKILLNDIAKKYNFDFTPEEAKKFAENLRKNELSLDDLSEVSGGIRKRAALIAFTALTALGSVGSAGAVVSHAGQIFSTPGKNNNNKADGNNNNIISEESNSEDSGNDTTPTTSDNENYGNNNKMKIKKDEELKKEIENLDKKIQNGKNEINIKNVNNNENTIDNNDETKQKKRKEKEKKKRLEEDRLKKEKEEKRLEEDKRKEKEEKLNKLNSEIINEDNINIFEGLVSKTDNLKLVYRMTRDGANEKAMQNKLKGHSNVVVLVKTNENKIFGGYTSCKIEYNNSIKYDNKSFLFSIDLNEKFNIKENRYAFDDNDYYEIKFGNNDLVSFDRWNECYSFFGSEYSNYENNGITSKEFCGGELVANWYGERIIDIFTPVEIEVFERTDVEVTPQEESNSEKSKDLFDSCRIV